MLVPYPTRELFSDARCIYIWYPFFAYSDADAYRGHAGKQNSPAHTKLQGCMPGVPLDMPICCPSVFPSMQVAISRCPNAAQACQQKHAVQKQTGSILHWCTDRRKVTLIDRWASEEEKIRIQGSWANPCGLRVLTPAPVNLSLVSRRRERNRGQRTTGVVKSQFQLLIQQSPEKQFSR